MMSENVSFEEVNSVDLHLNICNLILLIAAKIIRVIIIIIKSLSPLVVAVGGLASLLVSEQSDQCSPITRNPCSGTSTSPDDLICKLLNDYDHDDDLNQNIPAPHDQLQ